MRLPRSRLEVTVVIAELGEDDADGVLRRVGVLRARARGAWATRRAGACARGAGAGAAGAGAAGARRARARARRVGARRARGRARRRRRAGAARSERGLQERRVVGGAQAGDRVPARLRGEAVRAAARVLAARDVVERLRVRVEPRVEEAEHRLALREQLVVDQRDDAGEDGRCAGCAVDGRDAPTDLNLHVAALRRDVGVRAAGLVVCAVVEGADALDVRVHRVRLCESSAQVSQYLRRRTPALLSEVVAETTSREVRAALRDVLGRANERRVRASRERGRELALGARDTRGRRNTAVASREKNASAARRELQVGVAH